MALRADAGPPVRAPLSCVAEYAEGATVLRLAGEIDLATADEVWRTARLARAQGTGLVLDLRYVTFLDGSGLRAIDQLRADSRRKGYRLLVEHPSTFARHLLILTGFVDLLADG